MPRGKPGTGTRRPSFNSRLEKVTSKRERRGRPPAPALRPRMAERGAELYRHHQAIVLEHCALRDEAFALMVRSGMTSHQIGQVCGLETASVEYWAQLMGLPVRRLTYGSLSEWAGGGRKPKRPAGRSLLLD